MTNHFEEQERQVAYLLSLKYAAQASLTRQMNNFKANLLVSNLEAFDASIQYIVDEIWKSYDLDNNGSLDKKEFRKAINELMPDMLDEFEFTE